MNATTNQQRMLMIGNAAVKDGPAYPLPDTTRDPLAPAAWPKVLGSVSLLLGILGICFIPPPDAMAVVAPQSQSAEHLFPDYYTWYSTGILVVAMALHIALAAIGIAAMRYSPQLRIYYTLYIIAYVAYIFLAVFGLIHVMSAVDLSTLSQSKRISILEAERSFYYVMAVSLLWPAFLVFWFLSPTIASQIHTWATAAFRERLKDRKQRRARG